MCTVFSHVHILLISIWLLHDSPSISFPKSNILLRFCFLKNLKSKNKIKLNWKQRSEGSDAGDTKLDRPITRRHDASKDQQQKCRAHLFVGPSLMIATRFRCTWIYISGPTTKIWRTRLLFLRHAWYYEKHDNVIINAYIDYSWQG